MKKFHTSDDLIINGVYAYNHKGLNILLDRIDPMNTPTLLIILGIADTSVDTLYFRKKGMERYNMPIDLLFKHLDNNLLEYVEVMPRSDVKKMKKMLTT